MKTYNWGIISPGKIAHKFAEGLRVVPHAKLYAVASSSQERANEFAKKYDVQKAYNSYEELVTDTNVDIVYIASTNNFHFEHAKLCLENKKACLCEKPFTLNSQQLAELISIARKNKVFLMEALWTMFLPSIQTIETLLTNNTIGKIQTITVDFGFEVPYSESSRLFSPELGGGALLDIGIYPLFLALHVLGAPTSIEASMQKTPLGIDISDTITLLYNNNVSAKLRASFSENLACEALIIGELGTIKIHRMWHCPSQITVEKNEVITDYTPQYIGNGYNYEIQEVQNCLEQNLLESTKMPLSFSTLLMQHLDAIKQICDK